MGKTCDSSNCQTGEKCCGTNAEYICVTGSDSECCHCETVGTTITCSSCPASSGGCVKHSSDNPCPDNDDYCCSGSFVTPVVSLVMLALAFASLR
jgi:hypothetical protein